MYPFLATTTLYWIATNTFTADPAWPFNILLPHHLTFSIYNNLGFIHIKYPSKQCGISVTDRHCTWLYLGDHVCKQALKEPAVDVLGLSVTGLWRQDSVDVGRCHFGYIDTQHTLKGSPLAVSLQVMWVINLAVGCHYFPPGPQLPLQPLRGLLPILLLVEQRHNGCEQFA